MSAGFDPSKILKMKEMGFCNEELQLERLKINSKDFNLYKVPFPGIAIVWYDKNDEIITNKYFSLQLSTNILIPTISGMKETTANKLIKYLKKR